MSNQSEMLISLSEEELEALADSRLAPSAQARLDELLAEGGSLSVGERQELDRILRQADQLTVLKTRARYTLRESKVAAAAS